ncbi:hypothetical protein V5799_005687 [Amblyomma americanum]|uniref:Secreted protein n=1 Tax=Amblyomma americanum TaxID=6943 RepID=A0AAQ4DYJ2_AMBAM
MARLRNAEPLLRLLVPLILLLRPISPAEAAARKDSGAAADGPLAFRKDSSGLQAPDTLAGSFPDPALNAALYGDAATVDSSLLKASQAPDKPEDVAAITAPGENSAGTLPQSQSPGQNLEAEVESPPLHTAAEALVQSLVETAASSSASPPEATDAEQEEEPGEPTTTAAAPPGSGFDLESNLRAVIERIFKEALPLVYRFSTGAGSSPECMGALFKWVLAIRRLEPWALRSE